MKILIAGCGFVGSAVARRFAQTGHAVWGLRRREGVFEIEDHISGVSDVMRWLVERPQPLADQRFFFETYLYPGAAPFCAAVQSAAAAAFYRPVAAFALAFFELEKAALDMVDSEPRVG